MRVTAIFALAAWTALACMPATADGRFTLPTPPATLVDTEGEPVEPEHPPADQSEADTAEPPSTPGVGAEAQPAPRAAPDRRPIDRAVLLQVDPPQVPGFNPALPDGGVGKGTCPDVPRSMFANGQLRVQPGRSHMLAVSRKHLTRILTPFAQPDAISNSQHHEVLVEGRSLLLSMPPASCEPVGMFVFDKAGDPELAINLTLWPQDIPQVDVALVLPDELIAKQMERAGDGAPVAPAWDYRTPHVDALTTIMKFLAMGEVPPGMSFKALRGRPDDAPVCTFPGTSVVYRQVMESGRIQAYVASVRNISRNQIELVEADCAAPGVQAVAAWPSPLLEAGGSAELFVIVERAAPTTARTRPSVLD